MCAGLLVPKLPCALLRMAGCGVTLMSRVPCCPLVIGNREKRIQHSDSHGELPASRPGPVEKEGLEVSAFRVHSGQVPVSPLFLSRCRHAPLSQLCSSPEMHLSSEEYNASELVRVIRHVATRAWRRVGACVWRATVACGQLQASDP